MEKVRIAVIGAGDRGKDSYGSYVLRNRDKIEIVGVAEPNPIRREDISKKHNIPKEFQFDSWEKLLEKDRFCDGLIIATQDDMHFEPATQAMKKGYHILLEKPMSNDPRECVELGRLAKETNRAFMICHVLRYTPFYSYIKNIIDEGTIGDVIDIQHNENIGFFHFAHSFVRGNWRNSDLSSPLILAKSCHDMDIMLWFAGKRCKKVTSYGELSFFKKERAYEGSGKRCDNCSVEADCPYSAVKLYYKTKGGWPATVITHDQTDEGIAKAIKEGPYGRCVFKCDNNVVDHQVTILEFEDGITATFNLSAFSNKVHRTLKIMGTRGEIRANDSKNEIEIQRFADDKKIVINPLTVSGGHGGGDHGIMEDFISLIRNNEGKALTSADISVESHIMAFAAEESRVGGKAITLEDFYRKY